jgi:hypothetical protein
MNNRNLYLSSKAILRDVGIEYLLGASQHEKIFFEAVGNLGFLNIQKGTVNCKNNTARQR